MFCYSIVMSVIRRICAFYSRQVHVIAVLLGLAFAALYAIKADPGSVSFDLFALFYGGITGYAVAGFFMVPVFIFLKFTGDDQRPAETTSAMEALLFRRHKKKAGKD